jgi:hypothetical protein
MGWNAKNDETVAAVVKSASKKQRKSAFIRYQLITRKDDDPGVFILATIKDNLDGQSYGRSRIFRGGLKNQVGRRNVE